MQRLSYTEFSEQAAHFDALLAKTPEIDHFCSCSDWILPAQAAFSPDAAPYIVMTDEAAVVMMGLDVSMGRVGVPLEASWGLACPFAGPPRQVVELLVGLDERWPLKGLFLSGLKEKGAYQREVVERFQLRGRRLGVGPECLRWAADLEGGVDGFLGRRSSKFRANLRRGWRKGLSAGFRFEWITRPTDADAIYDRIIAIERRCWKGQEGVGIDEGGANLFYRLMIRRLVARGAFRAVIAQKDGQDAAYVFGGLFGDTYRGLQVSYVEAYRPFGLGNLVQYAMIQNLCAEGIAIYDLGTDVPYKQRWAEPGLTTITLAVLR